MNTPIRLTPADHVLIHGCGTLLVDHFVTEERERDNAMIQTILRRVLDDTNQDNLALAHFHRIAPELVEASERHLHILRSRHAPLIRDYHRAKMAAAWDMIRERYPHA
ncbi:hypothetical protein PARHAE_01104 [Paracoccus haematequi]|uniref:Uncharacterized protein n=1 Tax=Paracoccus haematequi TaxID=2491866 RepID=A0A3S4DV03_9RHOB|nr:hypothetical protein [Paracoccus haematequi]VDS07924.1 hypothetical protein PARHAE_01104 [Paracoccus haematequi]